MCNAHRLQVKLCAQNVPMCTKKKKKCQPNKCTSTYLGTLVLDCVFGPCIGLQFLGTSCIPNINLINTVKSCGINQEHNDYYIKTCSPQSLAD